MTPRRLRLTVLVAGLLAAAAVLAAWTQPWYQLVLDDGRALEVLGQDAAPALSVIVLASVALLAALMIARPRLRIVLGTVQLALGVLAVVLVAPLALSSDASLQASSPVITDATGVAGAGAGELVAQFAETAWPPVALVGSVLAVLVGLAIVATARRWPVPTAKYDTGTKSTETSAGTWDALSEGDDPTAR